MANAKKKFDWEYFLDKSTEKVVHCETKKDADAFRMMLHEHGCRWNSGNPYTSNVIGQFEEYPDKKGICYTNGGKFCDLSYYNENGYEILRFSAYDFT